jgi:hypothetical protein
LCGGIAVFKSLSCCLGAHLLARGTFVATVLVVVVALLLPAQALADNADSPSGSVGYDVSFPQCDKDLGAYDQTPDGAAPGFAIIGVTGGRPFTENHCLTAEYESAVANGYIPSFYMNVSAPRNLASAQSWALPDHPCDPGDAECESYSYGWAAAQDAADYALTAIASVADGPDPAGWWLDVETGNYWSPDQTANDQVIQGALDYLASNGNGATVGIYSVRSMWDRIAGASFRPLVISWLAGARSLGAIPGMCSGASFTGDPVALVQITIAGHDWDYVC